MLREREKEEGVLLDVTEDDTERDEDEKDAAGRRGIAAISVLWLMQSVSHGLMRVLYRMNEMV